MSIARRRARGFSLIEVLLAVVILGLGVISIAALFPAGIAQQRLSNDDVMGPIVADHAMSVLRSKLRPSDFGSFEEFVPFDADGDHIMPGPSDERSSYISRTINGDWGWMRPGYFRGDNDDLEVERGTLDVFSFYLTHREHDSVYPVFETPVSGTDFASEFPNGWPDLSSVTESDRTLWGIPYNRNRYNFPAFGDPVRGIPRVLIAPTERAYPTRSKLTEKAAGTDPNLDEPEVERPQYYWDCMFRKFNGRVYVAVFVYRVNTPGGDRTRFRVPSEPYDDADLNDRPALPFRLNWIVEANASGSPFDDEDKFPWNVAYDANDRQLPFVPGVFPADLNINDPRQPRQGWQQSRQWLLDQNMNIHRVLGRERGTDAGSRLRIELQRPLPPISTGRSADRLIDTTQTGSGDYSDVGPRSNIIFYYYADDESSTLSADGINGFVDEGVVTDIWYLPTLLENEETGEEFTITPVYITVKEL